MKRRGGQWIRPTTRWAIYLRDGLRCVYCQETALELALARDGFLTLDHFKPRRRAGDDRPGNLVTCCYDCNQGKGSGPLSVLARRRGWNHATVQSRAQAVRARAVEIYRPAAHLLLGMVPGVPRARIVDLMSWRARAQWAGDAERGDWQRMDLQLCGECGRISDTEEPPSPFGAWPGASLVGVSPGPASGSRAKLARALGVVGTGGNQLPTRGPSSRTPIALLMRAEMPQPSNRASVDLSPECPRRSPKVPVYTDQEKIQACVMALQESARRAAHHFGVSPKSVRNWLGKSRFREAAERLMAGQMDLTDEKLFTIEGLLLRGWETSRIADRLKKQWGMGPQQCLDAMKTVRARWAEEAAVRLGLDFEALYEEHRRRLLAIYEASMVRVDKAGARRSLVTAYKVTVSLAQLDGFLTTRSVNIQGDARKTTNNAPELETEEYMRQVQAVLQDAGYQLPEDDGRATKGEPPSKGGNGKAGTVH